MMNAIVNTKIVLEDGIIFDGVLLHENGIIVAVGSSDEISIPSDADIVDANGLYTAPGLIDIHNHGTKWDSFHIEPQKCASFFLSHGETTILPTLYCTLSLQEMLDGIKRIRNCDAGNIAGLYMEGPYMSGEGSNQSRIMWQGEIRKDEYQPLLEAAKGYARIWAIDPARLGIRDFMTDVLVEDPSAIFALGHSHATAAQCRSVKQLGVRVQTHHGDSGKAPGRNQVTPGAGCDEFTLYDPDLYAEIICDRNGIHLPAETIRMVVRAKGVERVILITDSMNADGDYRNNETKGVLWGPDLNYDDEGMLAGSHLTLDDACRNMMIHTGYGICHAIRMASLNPARLLGIDNEVGSIEAGKKANLILMDDAIRVKRVFLNGKTVSYSPADA